MKRIKLSLVWLIVLVLGFESAQAYDFYKAMDEGKNFYQIQKEANAYWNARGVTIDSPKEKRGGYKQYKRWEWFWEQRVYPTGQFPVKAETWLVRGINKKSQNNKKTSNGLQYQAADYAWSFVGPKTAPGGYDGLGRINSIVEDPDYDGSTNKTIWAGSAGGGLWKSTDAGSSWATSTDDLGTLGVGDIVIEPDNSDVMYLATGDGDHSDAKSIGVLKSTDGGASWNSTGLNWNLANNYVCRRILMDPDNHSILYVATNGGIYKTTNSGTNWSQVFTTDSYDMEFKPNDSKVIYAATYTEIYKTTNSGTNWTKKTDGLPSSNINRIALGVSADDANVIYAEYGNENSGHKGFYRSTNAGEKWTLRDDQKKNFLGWYTDGSGTGGQSWYDLAIVVNPNNADEVLIGGINIWKSTDGGATFKCVSMWYDGAGVSAVHADQHTLYYANEGRLYSGNDGGVDVSTDQGSNWSYIGDGLCATQLYRLGVSQTNIDKVICGAQDNSGFYINADTVKKIWLGDGFESLIDYNTEDNMYSASYYGNCQATSDGGANWYDVGKPSGEEGGNWLTPYVNNPSDHTKILFGFGEIYEWTQTDKTFKKISTLGIGSMDNLYIAPSNSQYIYAGTYSSWRKTTNGGTSWSTITSPASLSWTYLAINPHDPLDIWATFSGYSNGSKIYHSTNGGSNWTNITKNLPNVPCNTVCFEKRSSNSRIYVGTDVGVYFKLISDTDWTKLDESLPNVVVTELEIQKDNNVLFASTFGRGVWKVNLPTVASVTLLNPKNKLEQLAAKITFEWTSAEFADSYQLQVSRNSGFTDIVLDTTMKVTKITKTLATEKEYFWRVRAKSGSENSPWSETFSFKNKDAVLSQKELEVTLRMFGLWNGSSHKQVALSAELWQGSTLMGAKLKYKKPVAISSNGKISCSLDDVQDGNYWLVLRAGGYLTLGSTSQISVSTTKAYYDFTSGYSSAAGGEYSLYYTGGVYYMKPGESNSDLKINAIDGALLLGNKGKNLTTYVPEP